MPKYPPLQRHLPTAIALGFLLLWSLSVALVARNWHSHNHLIQQEVLEEANSALRAKAADIAGILQRTYHTVRTISLLPGVRSLVPYNRSSEAQDVVQQGRMSSADYDTVQQLYNQIASSVSVSEIYLIHDGFNPDKGQIPFVMLDHIIVERARANTTAAANQHGSDIPQEDESEEYKDYVRQLAYFRTYNLHMPDDGLDSIAPINSGAMRTCDNSQYTSIAHGDVHNATGFSVSVPIYDAKSRLFKGLVTAILRSNVLEAELIGLAQLPVTDAEWQQVSRNPDTAKRAQPVNFLLENKDTGIRIFDRRNDHWAQASTAADVVQHFEVELKLPGTRNWVLHNYVSKAELDQKLGLLRNDALTQFGMLSLALGLLWLSVHTMLNKQRLATEKLQLLADELERVNVNLEQIVQARTNELLEKNLELEHLSVTDRLTGLCNRLKLDQTLDDALNRHQRYHSSFALVLLDVDHFKSVNDTFGHTVGDQVLVAMADMFKSHTRKTDTIGRWGGEEFLIVCHDTDALSATAFAEKLRQKIADHSFPMVGRATCSFGVTAVCPEDTILRMMARADAALYRAKASGRNRVERDV